MRAAVVWAVLLGLVIATAGYLTGDGLRDARPSVRHPVATVQDAGCPTEAGEMAAYDGSSPAVVRGTIPLDFRPRSLVRCRFDSVFVDRASTRSRFTVTEERAEALPADLLGALSLPDQEFSRPNMACNLLPPPWVVISVVDEGGRSVTPRIPTDPCGHPRREVTAALQPTTWSVATTTTFEGPRTSR